MDLIHDSLIGKLNLAVTDSEAIEQDDPVNHPAHYNSGNFEVIDIIQDQLSEEAYFGFCLGNALKYICRAGKKDAEKITEDLRKAIWYLSKIINEEKEEEE